MPRRYSHRRPLNGEKIRRRRRHLGLSQADLARRVGVDQKTISRYERGEIAPEGENLTSLAAALETQPWWLAKS
jgi:transcriptional regulator with XRE-family HTH domain